MWGRANLGLLFDAYHIGKSGLPVLATLARHWHAVRHLQIAGVPDRHEPDPLNEAAPLFAWLDAQGYPGWVACEYHPRATTLAGLGWLRKTGDTDG